MSPSRSWSFSFSMAAESLPTLSKLFLLIWLSTALTPPRDFAFERLPALEPDLTKMFAPFADELP